MSTTSTTISPNAVMTENSPHNGMSTRPAPSTYLTIDGLLRSNASEDDDIHMVGYPEKGVSDYEVHTAKTIDRYVDAACWWYQEQGLLPADPNLEKAPVAALLTVSGLDAIVSFFALNRLGWAVLFLSTRLTAPAYVSLMKLADCNTIISHAISAPIIQEMQNLTQCTSLPRIESPDYRSRINVPKFFRDCDKVKESRKIGWIIHSSGSTGFPKPIFITNFGCLANWQKGLGFRSFTVSPLFHSHALMEFGRAIYAKRPMFFGNYAFPVTRQNLLAAMKVAKPEMVCAVPYVLKLLAEKEEGIVELAKAKIVMYGGSACPDTLGDELVSKGVRLAGNYGATETGFIMNSFRPIGDNEWNYLRLHRPVADFVLMDEISPGVFEAVALDGLPSKDTTNSDDPPNSFRTRDLFTRHPNPNKSNYWKYLSRLDDRITLVNGEKVLPIPIEGHIRQHELIYEAAVFGVQKTVPGILIFRSEYAAHMSDEEFLARVWPQIEAANSQAETFSHIAKDLVIPMPAGTAYPRTDKGTIIRAQLYEQFAGVINDAYDRFENGTTSGIAGDNQLQLGITDLEAYLLTKFRVDLQVDLESADSDIFAAGVDSLQTTRLWTSLKRDLDLGGNASKMSQNIVFERGTVKSLAKYLYNLRMGIEDSDTSDEEADIERMRDLIEKYSAFTPHDPTNKPTITSTNVLLTGATGGLGAHLLFQLLQRPDITTIYALVRASSPSDAQSRVLKSLSSRKLLDDLSPAHLSKLISLPSDLTLPTLGLPDSTLDQLKSTITHTIHVAYPVNFNLPLLTFEPAILSLYNLLTLSLSTTHSRPATVHFASSISAASGTPKPATIPELHVPDLHHAQNMGYGRSKLVCEHITRICREKTGVGHVLRIGQLAGDTRAAMWNDTEAIALLVRSLRSGSAGCLPRLSGDKEVSWLAVDVAAGVCADLVFHESEQIDSLKQSMREEDEVVYHILNPATFPFEEALLPMLKAHPDVPDFEIVDVQTWLERLRASDDDVRRNPSRKLLGFWEGKYGGGKSTSQGQDKRAVDANGDVAGEVGETAKGLTFETRRTSEKSRRLGEMKDPISDGLMARIVGVWMEKWREEEENL